MTSLESSRCKTSPAPASNIPIKCETQWNPCAANARPDTGCPPAYVHVPLRLKYARCSRTCVSGSNTTTHSDPFKEKHQAMKRDPSRTGNRKMKHLAPSQIEDTTAQSFCRECGLCCSGAIFADVELKNEDEATALESMGLEIEEEDGRHLLIQPCHALAGTQCTLYAHRPECCRTFECRMLRDLKTGHMEHRNAVDLVQKIRTHIADKQTDQAREIIETHLLHWR